MDGRGTVATGLHHIRNRQENSEENDPYGEEPPEMRVSPEFLKNLPGVQASDSMGYRIEALRVYLETQLGDKPFITAYQHFMNMGD